MPQQFRKKPVVVEAEQYQGRNDIAGVCRRMDCAAQGISKPHVHTIHNNQAVLIEKGDWIIPETDGLHFYPCKPDIFEASYVALADTAPMLDWIEETDGDMPVLACAHCRAVIRFTVNADSELMRRAMGEHRCGGEE